MTTCTRFPCDSAYRRREHTPDENGTVVHFTSSGGCSSDGWISGMVAYDDEPWRPWLRIGDEQTDFAGFEGPFDQARRMADGIVTATVSALQANLKDARQEVDA